MRAILTSVGSLPRLPGLIDEAMIEAVRLQRRFGLDLLTDGEQRGDMLALYDSFPGIRVEGGIPRIVGRVRPLEDTTSFSKIRDLDFLRGRFPDLRFKVSLTGPSTFAFACASSGAGPAYRSAVDLALHDDLTEAIRPIAHEVCQRGADLQIDDPILSQGMRDYGAALRRLDAIASEFPRDRASLHVCGGLARGKVLHALLGLENFSVLNLAFAGRAERENLDLLDGRAWEERDLFLGAGCIDVQVASLGEVMSTDATSTVLRAVADRIGRPRVRYVMPTCGLRATSGELVAPLLGNLRAAFESVFPRGT